MDNIPISGIYNVDNFILFIKHKQSGSTKTLGKGKISLLLPIYTLHGSSIDLRFSIARISINFRIFG